MLQKLIVSRRPWAGLVLVIALVAISWTGALAPRSAQAQTAAERKCINKMNRDFQTLASRIGKEFRGCLRDFALDRLGGGSASECFGLDRRGRIAVAELKTRFHFDLLCIDDFPPYGASDPNTISNTAKGESLALISLLFGQVDTVVVTEETDRPQSGCQRSVAREVSRCWNRQLREFNRCKRSGMRRGVITDATSLWSTCLGADPGGRVARDCDPVTGRIRTRIGRACVDRFVDLSESFPPCGTDDWGQLAECLEAGARCRTCLGLARADALDPGVCDDFDDGTANQSCLPSCGNGALEPALGEQCDDGNTLSCDGCSVTCQLEAGSTCGDGILNAACGEECDDSNVIDEDGCSAVCLNEFCGDGTIQAGLGEACDDGNAVPCDGCSNTCQIEPGGVCGDGILYATCEQCEDGNQRSCDGCSSSCDVEVGFACGDGILNAACGEQCDEAILASCDGCSASCRLESGFICGDGVVNAACGEECDDGGTVDEDGCSSACLNEFCGDNVVQALLGEVCDDGNSVSCDGCSESCQIEPGGVCGDGILNAACEVCDDGGSIPCDGCSATCEVEVGFVCGDGVVNAACNEECDDSNVIDEDGCSSACLTESCGDGVVQALLGEACDDGNTTFCDGCSEVCQIEPGGACGDGSVSAACGEQCDDGNTDSCDGCSEVCQTETAFVCGDGVVTNSACEPCDDGNPASCDGCSGACQPETGLVCGDGILNEVCGEECDDGNTSTGDFCTPLCENDPCEPTGTYDTSTILSLSCGSPSYFVDLQVGGWDFSDAGGGTLDASPRPSVKVDGALQSLSGPLPTCPGSFEVSTTHPGFCCTILTLSGEYTGRDSWLGFFEYAFCDRPACGCPMGVVNACGSCSGSSGLVSVSATRAP